MMRASNLSVKVKVGSVAATVLLSGTLVSLGGLSSAFQSSVRPAKTQKVIHLVYWNMWSGHWETLVKSMVAEFNRTHPLIQVKTLAVPAADGDAKLLTAIAAGNPPDVFTEWNSSIGSFANNGSLVNLNQFMRGSEKKMRSWFYPIALKWATYKGGLYGLPWTMNSDALFYNKTMMKRAGLNPNRPPKTLAQLNAEQAKLWKFSKNGAVQQMGFYDGAFNTFAGTFGVKDFIKGKYDLLTPQAKADMKFLSTFKKYPFSKVSGFSSAFSAAAGGAEDPFDMGKAGFYVNGMWEIPQIQANDPRLQYGVAPLPAPPGGHYGASTINGNYNIIPKNAKYPKAAWTFITWLSGYGNVAWAASHDPLGGWLPPSPKVANAPAYKKFIAASPNRAQFVKALANPYDHISAVTPAEQFYQTTMATEQDDVLEGKVSPIAALKAVQQAANKQLQQDVAP